MTGVGVLRHRRIIVGGFLALATLNLMNSAYSNVLETIKAEMGLSYTQSGALMSAYFVGYMLGQIPWGMLADSRGSRPTITLSVIGVSASTMLFGLSRTVAFAMASRFLAGLLGAGIFVPSVRLVSAWFNSEERGTALGVLNIGGSVGLVAASWAVPLISLDAGWRLTIRSAGAIGVAAGAAVWLLLRDRDDPNNRGLNLSSLPFRDRDFWLLAFTQFIRLGSYYTLIAWLPLILKEEYGLSIVATSGALSLFNLAGMLANPLGGVVSDRVGKRSVLMASFALLGLDVLFFAGRLTGLWVYLAVLVLGWFINFVRSPSFTIISDVFGTEAAGSISGVHNTFASLGALVLPYTLGFIKDYTLSYRLGWLSVSVFMFIGVGLFSQVRAPERVNSGNS
ncbi:MFS transporter [Candidatus Bathyarchaeota archaeon]|nr:MFS transporter [Candidatus Bathyarchaeota archaeon]